MNPFAARDRATHRNTPATAVLVCSMLLLATALPPQALGQTSNDQWRFSLMPYVWLPGLDGTFRYGVPPGSEPPVVEVDADTLLGAIDSVLMLSAEARNDRWLLMTDYIYLDLTGESSAAGAIDVGSFLPAVPDIIGDLELEAAGAAEISGSSWTVIGGRVLSDDERSNFAVIGGLRLFGLDATIDYRASATIDLPGGPRNVDVNGSLLRGDDLLDLIVGVRGRVALGDGGWFAPYYLDVGTGDSDLTWQGMLGIGHGFGWGDLLLAYRHLSYEHGDEASLIKDLRFSGFGVGANIRF